MEASIVIKPSKPVSEKVKRIIDRIDYFQLSYGSYDICSAHFKEYCASVVELQLDDIIGLHNYFRQRKKSAYDYKHHAYFARLDSTLFDECLNRLEERSIAL
jgi:hypothetical protein